MASDDLENDSTVSSHEWKVDQALKRHGRSLFKFWHFLHDFPMLGLAHPAGRKIIRELKAATKTTLGASNWFRANLNREFLTSRPPPELVGDQRYNNSGQSYYYLANHSKCAAAEATYSEKSKTAWVQQFQVERLENILDLRSWSNQDENVDEKDERYSLFIMALIFSDLLTQLPEHYFDQLDNDRSKIKWKPAYLMPRFIADAARHCGFSGLLYSSVRYRRENLVVFDPEWNPKADGDSYEELLTDEDLIVDGRFVFNHGKPIFLQGSY